MQKLLKATFILLVSCFPFSCNPSKNIAGVYRSNFAVAGFFVTKLTLNSDSTFGYRMRGDLSFDTANGNYKIDNRDLILFYSPPPIDTTVYYQDKKNGPVQVQPLTNSADRPKKLYIKNNKLFLIDTSGNIKKTEQGLSKHRKYLFWGQYYYVNKRRYYLKRTD